MNTKQTVHMSQEKLLAVVRSMIGGSRGREDDEHPLPPGPWDPVIRAALGRVTFFGPHPEPWRSAIESVFGPQPEPWRTAIESVFGPFPQPWKVIFASIAAKHPEIWDVIGGAPDFGAEVALNPQPLPPRLAFLISLAQTVISRAELIQEIADVTHREIKQQGIAGGYISRFIDDICGNDFRFRWPFPGPRPNWFAKEVNGIDLIVMAMQFEQAAKETFSPDLRQNLTDASRKFVDAGLAKIQ